MPLFYEQKSAFNGAAAWLGREIFSFLECIDDSIKEKACEIRLRSGCPVNIIIPGKRLYVLKSGNTTDILTDDCIYTTPQQVCEAFNSLCAYSVHSHSRDIENGYITVSGGHRAGICGTAVVQNGRVCGVRNVSGINLRIARNVEGAAAELEKMCFSHSPCGVLIAGAPASGKTTVLRDAAARLSSPPYNFKVSIADERGELAGVYKGVCGFNIGSGCDVFDGYPKAEAISIATRVMSPDYIISDEAGTAEECEQIAKSLCCGVSFLAAVHAGDVYELTHADRVKMLLKTGAFLKVVLLEGAKSPGKIKAVYESGEILNGKACGGNVNNGGGCDGGDNISGERR